MMVRMTRVGVFLLFEGRVTMDREGIGRFTVRLIDGLLRANADVAVHIVTRRQNVQSVTQAFAKLSQAYPLRLFIHTVPESHEAKAVDWLNAHVPVHGWIVPYVGMASAAMLAKPYIVCLHDLVYLHFPDLYFTAYPTVFEQLDSVVHTVVCHASRVVFSSQFTERHEGAQFLRLAPAKTAVIPLAAPTEEYAAASLPSEQVFREKYGLKHAYLTFPSVIRLHKNHDHLIEAFIAYCQSQHMQTLQLRLVFTDRYLHSPLRHQILSALNRCRDRDIRNSIMFLGRIDATEVPALYKYATGTIVPTLFEGSCPFQIIESLAMGTPVACSRLAVASEVLGDLTPFCPFDPHSVPEMMHAIDQLISAGETLKLQQQRAARRLLSRTWTDVAADYLTLFNQMTIQLK